MGLVPEKEPMPKDGWSMPSGSGKRRKVHKIYYEINDLETYYGTTRISTPLDMRPDLA